MTTQPTEKKFDPTTAGPINIVTCDNGWAVYHYPESRTHQFDSGCFRGPSYVFTSAAALGVAIANLVAHGTITKPLAPELPTNRIEFDAEVSRQILAIVEDANKEVGAMLPLPSGELEVQVWNDLKCMSCSTGRVTTIADFFRDNHVLSFRLAK